MSEPAGHPPLRFVVVGTGRCGTGSAAAALNAVGVRCGHEDVFTPEGVMPANGLLGDCSWLAAPHLARFGGRIAHLVREPVATAQSFLDLGFFDPEFDNLFSRFARRHLPLTGRPVDDAFRWYVTWNRLCETHAHVRYRLDELEALVRDLAVHATGREVDEAALAAAVAQPRNAKRGSKTRRHAASLEALADPKLRADVEALAARYGFA